jgi:hypothetical protein
MKKQAFHIAFGLGVLAVLWVAVTVASSHPLVLVMTAVIGAVYAFGMLELRQYRAHTVQLQQALANVPADLSDLNDWLPHVPGPLRNAVRQRVEGERNTLPGPALTPYLVGLLVMLGMLGTFLGMVVTLNGAVFALEGAASVQGMRAAFSEPIKGLGLAFGTSVAGVATSAMLGLMSSLSRRERAQAAQALDGLISAGLRRFSLAHQRSETFHALQHQSQLLPQVVEQLQTLMNRMEQHSQQWGERLLSQQDIFHREARATYTELASSVEGSLRSSLAQSMQVASDSIRPVVQATMADMAGQAQLMHARMVDSTREQLEVLHQQFSRSANTLSQAWTSALERQEQSSASLLGTAGQTLQQLSQTFETQAQGLLATVHTAHIEQQQQRVHADQQRLEAMTSSLENMAASLHTQWQAVGQQTLAQQQQICDTLTGTAQAITQEVQGHARQTLSELQGLVSRHDELAQARAASEATWLQQHQQQAQALASQLRDELSSLREQERLRGDAAVARLAELQSAVTAHLSTLGTALEAPITRLIETASEAPKAAAEVIGQLRQEISVSVARDNALLEERARIMETLSGLLDAIHHASTEQRGVIDALVSSSQASLAQANDTFQAQVAAETGKLGDIAAQVSASAVDVASLGETFGFAVRSFSETNDKLMAHLHGLETAMAQSMARSDEQLAYYVAQAREIIDLSISSQKDVLEALQQRQPEGAA